MISPGEIHRYSTKLLSPISKILGFIENKYFKNKKDKYCDRTPILFIVGPPRSGTTITYQCLTHCLEVNYPSNLTALFPNAPAAGITLNGLFRKRPHQAFESVHGYSLGDGLYGPNEWETLFGCKVFPELREYYGSAELEKFQSAWLKMDQTPLILKTLNAINHVEILLDYFPCCKFLYVSRTPIDTARSIYRAKKREGCLNEDLWYVKSGNHDVDSDFNHAEKICRQIKSIQCDFDRVKKNIPEKQWKCIDYTEFCNSALNEIKIIKEWLKPDLEWRKGWCLPKLEARPAQPLENQELEKVFRHEFPPA